MVVNFALQVVNTVMRLLKCLTVVTCTLKFVIVICIDNYIQSCLSTLN